MKLPALPNLVRTLTIAVSVVLAPLTVHILAQNTNTTTRTQTAPSTQSNTNTTQSTTKQTTTTAQSNQPAQTTRTESTSTIDPIWLIVGAVALLAILLIVILSMRGRSRDQGETVYESKTVVKKE